MIIGCVCKGGFGGGWGGEGKKGEGVREFRADLFSIWKLLIFLFYFFLLLLCLPLASMSESGRLATRGSSQYRLSLNRFVVCVIFNEGVRG